MEIRKKMRVGVFFLNTVYNSKTQRKNTAKRLLGNSRRKWGGFVIQFSQAQTRLQLKDYIV